MLLLTIPLPRTRADEGALSLFRKGEAAEFQEDYYRAVELYKEALLKNPDYLQPMARLAASFLALEQHDAALMWVRKARKLDRGSLELVILEGDILTVQGRVAEARALYEAVLQEEPYNVDARFGLARLDLADGKQRHAAVQYLETLKAEPENLQALLNLALLYESMGEQEASLAYLRQALAGSSDDPEVFYTAGCYYFAKGEYRTAEEYLGTALTLKPGYREAQQLLADMLIIQDRPAEAIPLLREVLDSQVPAVRHRAYYTLGLAYGGSGAVGEALQSLAWAVRLQPEDEVSRMTAENLAAAHPEETEEHRRRLAEFHFEEGTKLEKKNQLANAQVHYRRALMLDREYHEARLAYANIYRVRGFPYKYLMELLFLRDYYGIDDVEVLDDIEIYSNRLLSSVGHRWAARLDPLRDFERPFDQYSVAREPFRLALFSLPQENSLTHLAADRQFMPYVEALLMRSDALAIVPADAMQESFEDAFRAARSAGSDYFVILRFVEEPRSFRASAEVFLTRTGTALWELSVYRTGNERVTSALLKLTEQLAELFPLRGAIRAREFDQGVIDLGAYHGIEADDRFLVIKRDELGLREDGMGFTYQESDVLGEFVVTETDENLSEGTVKPANFFDRINPGDAVIPAPEDASGKSSGEPAA